MDHLPQAKSFLSSFASSVSGPPLGTLASGWVQGWDHLQVSAQERFTVRSSV